MAVRNVSFSTENGAAEFLILIIVLTALINFFFNITRNIYKYFLNPSRCLKHLGSWAVITGGTDGIGKAYAKALAKKGFNVVLISRSGSRLLNVKKEIIDEEKSQVKVICLVCDYSNFNNEAKTLIHKALKDLDIGILINNVGTAYRYPMYFHELSDHDVSSLIDVNITSTTFMTRIVLNGMLMRKRGAVVNLSSGSAMYTLPLLAQYSASKSYVEKFSKALHAEYYKQNGVSVQCQIPFYVSTKLSKMRKSFSVPSPEFFVERSLNFIGKNDPVVSPFWVHGIIGWILDQLPSFLVTYIIMKMHLGTRKRALNKEKKAMKMG